MSVSHIKTLTIADFTGTVTVFDSGGNTVTANATDIVRPSDWNSQHIQFLNIGGNYAGNSSLSGTDVQFFGGNNITLSQNGSTVTISGPNVPVQTSLSFSNANNITFGIAGSTLTASASFPAQTVQPVAVSGSNGSFVFSTLSLGNSNGASFYTSNGSVVMSYTVPPSQSNQTEGWYQYGNTTGQSSSSTMDARSIQISGAGIASVGMSGGTLIVSVPSGGGAGDGVNIVSMGTSTYGGGTGGQTFSSISDSLGLYAGSNITLSQTSNSIIIYGPTAGGGGGAAISAGTQSDNTGTVVFSNSNNVTFGMSNSSVVTASFSYSQSTAPGAIAAGTQTATSGTIVFSNSNNVSFTMNGSTQVVASASFPAQTVQPGMGLGVSNTGTTLGNTGTASSGTIVFAASGNITASQSTAAGSNSTIWFSVPAQSVQPVAISGSNGSFAYSTVTFGNLNGASFYTSNGSVVASYTVPTQSNQTLGIYASSQTMGQSSSSTYDARSLSVVGSGAISVGWSNSSLVISGTTQTNQSAIKGLGASNTGNTAGNTGISTGVDWVFAGTNNVTVSESTAAGGPNTLWISGPTVGGAQTGISSIAGGGTTYTSGSIQFVNSYNVSISSTTGQGFVFSASYSQSTAPGGIAAGTQTGTSGTIVFSNSNGISFGMSNSSVVTASYTVPTQTNQTLGIYASSQTMGQSSSSTYDARSLSVVGSGNISVGWSNSSLVISAPAGGGGGAAIGVSNTGTTLGNTGTASSGTIVFAASGNITASQSTAAGSNSTIWFSVPAQSTVPGHGLGVSNTGNTAGNTGTNASGTIVFAGSNMITASQSTAAGQSTIWINATQSVQPGVGMGVSNTGTTLGNTGTASSGTIVFAASGNITASQSTAAGSNSTIWFSVPAQSVQTQASGNIAGTNTSFGGTNISASMTMNSSGLTVSASVAAQSNQTLGMYVQGNTTGQSSSSTINATSFNVSGAGIASVGWSNSSLIVSVPAGGGGGDGYNIVSMLTSTSGGGTLGATFSTLSGSIGLMAGSNITLSQTSNTINIVGPAPFTGSWYQPELYGNTTLITQPNGTLLIRPFELDGYFDGDKLAMYHSFASSRSTFSISASVSAGNASSGSGSWGLTGTYIIFSRLNTNETNASYNSIISYNTGSWSSTAGYSASVSWSTNASSATASWTTSGAIGYISQIDGNGGVTTTSLTTTGSSTFSSTSNAANSFSSSYSASFIYSNFSGLRAVFHPMAGTNIPPGEYWMGIIHSTNTGSTNMPSLMSCASLSDGGKLFYTASTNNYLEIGNTAAFTSSGIRPIYGSYSASSNTTTAIALSQFSSMNSQASMWFAIDGHTK